MQPKSQVKIISAILIVVISIALFSAAYLWGVPLIRKREARVMVERVYSDFDPLNPNSLTSRIGYIAKMGGEDTFVGEVEGLWVLNEDEDYIQLSFFAVVTNIAPDAEIGWVSLTPGCNSTGYPPSAGAVGVDDPHVLCARADRVGEGFNITYRLWFRELYETPTSGYKIDLAKHPAGPLSSVGKMVRIFRERVHSVAVDGKTLILTEIKILLG